MRQYALDPGATFTIPWHSVRLTFPFHATSVQALCDADGHAEDECMLASMLEDTDEWVDDMPATAGTYKLKTTVDRYSETYAWGPLDMEEDA